METKRCLEDEGTLKPTKFRKKMKAVNTTYTCLVESGDEDKNFPMHLALAGLVVTPTGFLDLKERDAICDKIKIMSGTVSFAYTSRSTHLLAAHANTSKVELARRRNATIVTLEWLNDIWEACQNNNPYIHASYSCFNKPDIPLFYNLHFKFSDRYDVETRNFYENLVQRSGGKLATTLEKSPAYFYICQIPENEYYYQYAQDKGIYCVSLGWISVSIAKENLAEIRLYKVTPRSTESVEFGMTFNIKTDEEKEDNNGIMMQNEVMDENVFESDNTSKPSQKAEKSVTYRKKVRQRMSSSSESDGDSTLKGSSDGDDFSSDNVDEYKDKVTSVGG